MKKKLLLILAAALGGALSAPAAASAAPPCGLPDVQPQWIDFGTPELLDRFGRPGVVVAGSGEDYPTRARAAGAKTV